MQYLVLCLALCDAMAQSASIQIGARAHGVGNTSACLSGLWAMTGNIAGLAKAKGTSVGGSYHAVPSFKFFNRRAAAAAMRLRSGAAGAAVFRFGDDLYNEQVISLGFANSFGLASLGLKANYIQYRADGLDTRTAFTLSFGGLATLTPQLSFGAHIININQPVINELTGERISTTLAAGMSLKLSTAVLVAAAIEKDLRHRPVVKAGLEYRVVRKLAFRTGLNVHPESGFFGMGFIAGRFDLDYALQLSHPFGLSHQAAITFALRRE